MLRVVRIDAEVTRGAAGLDEALGGVLSSWRPGRPAGPAGAGRGG
jgi:hypothetical protein